ncbi:MAG: MspI family type II restriction endonuclease [Saprospiraceae bacterium]
MNKKGALSKSNSIKSKSGADFTKLVDQELTTLRQAKIIKDFLVNKNFSHNNFTYKNQFKADFLIETFDEKYLVVRSSNSFRSDRAKTSFYDLEGIIKYSGLSDNIIASIFLLSDEELNNTTFETFRKRVNQKEFYCPASHIFVVSEFLSFLKEYATTLENQRKEVEIQTKAQKDGSKYGKRGNQLERILVKQLSDYKHLVEFKNESQKNDIYSLIIGRILRDNKLDIDDVLKISATNTLPLLRNGGNAKTDLVLKIEDTSGNQYLETISIKNTDKNKVSCHDYSVDNFIRVLKCEGTKLAKYLTIFQAYPSYSGFEENLPKECSLEEFIDLLSKKENIFNQWVLMGKYDIDNLVTPELQVSKYLFILNEKNAAFYSLEEYIALLKRKRNNEKFGVPFSWTYPSKQRSKRIQLKVAIFFETKNSIKLE